MKLKYGKKIDNAYITDREHVNNFEMNKISFNYSEDINENVHSIERMSEKHRETLRENISNLNNNVEKFKLSFSLSNPFRKKHSGSFASLAKDSSKIQERSPSETARSLQQAKTKYNKKIIRSIPCLSFTAGKSQCFSIEENSSNRLILYFHANAEDLSHISYLLEYMSRSLNVSVLAPEYPGYSVYSGQPTESFIIDDADAVYQFAVENLKIPPHQIFISGRSIGSGPAVHLASKFELGGLILFSPFSSIKEVVKDKVGTLLSNFVKERFDNLSKIPSIKCKLKIVHGDQDDIVNIQHSKFLAGSII